MKKINLKIFLIFIFLCAIPLISLAKNEEEFLKQLNELKSPIELMKENKIANVKVGDAFFLPYVAEDVIPTDEKESVVTQRISDIYIHNDQIASVNNLGHITALKDGTTKISYAVNENSYELTLNVSNDSIPFDIQNMIYLAKYEFLSNHMQRMPKFNKYAKWYYKNKREVGWCSVFVSYLTNASGMPSYKKTDVSEELKNKVFGVLEGQVGTQWEAFRDIERFGNEPKPGYYVIYGNRKNGYKHTHIGLVVDVKKISDHKFQITTIEGNMSNTVKSYCYIYDSAVNHPSANMSVVPKEEQIDPLIQYKLHTDYWSVFGFCQTW